MDSANAAWTTGMAFTEDDIVRALADDMAREPRRPSIADGSPLADAAELGWVDLRSGSERVGPRGRPADPLRWTIASMMAGVAVIAVALAALPYLRLSPVPTLTAAALIVSILAVARLGRDRRLIRVAMVLYLIAGLSLGMLEVVSLFRLSARYQRLSRHHAMLMRSMSVMIRAFDRNPRNFGAAKDWEARRPEWVRSLEKETHLASAYAIAAAQPWRDPETIPPPP
jgi:hypothetical protein